MNPPDAPVPPAIMVVPPPRAIVLSSDSRPNSNRLEEDPANTNPTVRSNRTARRPVNRSRPDMVLSFAWWLSNARLRTLSQADIPCGHILDTAANHVTHQHGGCFCRFVSFPNHGRT